MTTRRTRRGERPRVEPMERRLIPSASPFALPLVAPTGPAPARLARAAIGARPTSSSVVPRPGNPSTPLDAWLGLHNQYVARATAARDNVVFLGDSITYLWGDASRQAPGSVPWSQSIAPFKAANFGIGSDQTQGLLWRV